MNVRFVDDGHKRIGLRFLLGIYNASFHACGITDYNNHSSS